MSATFTVGEIGEGPAGVCVDLVVALLEERQQRRDALPHHLHRRRRVLVPEMDRWDNVGPNSNQDSDNRIL